MKKIFLITGALITLASCNNDDLRITDDPVALHVRARIGENEATTRATDTSWDVGDAIGVSLGATTNFIAANYKYTTENGDGLFTGTPMCFPDKTTATAVYAYYPFMGVEGTSNGTVNVSIATQEGDKWIQTLEKQAEIDFMTANITTAATNKVSGGHPDAELVFTHRMAKLTFTFTPGEGVPEGTRITEFSLGNNISLAGTFNTLGTTNTTCTLSNKDIDKGTVTVYVNDEIDQSTGATSASMIVFRAQSRAGLTLTLKDSQGQQYSTTAISGAGNFAAGTHYKYNITFNKTTLQISNVTILDWETGEEINGNASSSDDPEDE